MRLDPDYLKPNPNDRNQDSKPAKESKQRRQYRIYMHSPNWTFKRRQVLARDNYRCVVCNTKINLQIHHLTYERFGNELLDDLVTLCETHHKQVHEND